MKRIFIAVMAMVSALPLMAFEAADPMALEQKSPDGNIVLKFEINSKGAPVYSLTYKGLEVKIGRAHV